jgi:tRNA-dihydrouridine synthase
MAARLEADLATGAAGDEPGAETRLEIVFEQLEASLAFYGPELGLKIFRKHLGWYVEQAPWPADAQARRQAKAALCRLDDPAVIRAELARLWLAEAEQDRAA